MSCGGSSITAGPEHEMQPGLPPRAQASMSPRWFRWLVVSAIKK